MERVVIAAYRPKPGKADALRALMHTHLPRLRGEGLVTARESILMQASDGTFIEVFEWRSQEAIEAAHHNPAVLAMWSEYAEVCEYVPVGSIAEAQQLFSEFTPVSPSNRTG
ncbi:MAG TPA: antibiotic biosynthesis monooxygenase [Sphingomicrobium sp.]|nr:antibiotic biosynthesis monooxygenase [Sphingomicrobium sp.]